MAELVGQALSRSSSLFEHAAAQPGVRSRIGRGTTFLVELAGRDWVVRHYHRGGWMGPLLGDRYPRGGEPRPFRELRLAQAARARNIATPEVLAAVTYTGRGPFYRGDLATAAVPGAVDLAELTFGPDAWTEKERTRAWGAAGRTMRQSFQQGLWHADLNLRNIVVAREDDALDAYLIDLDRGRLLDRLPRAAVRRMLERLDRSRRKWERRTGRAVGAAALDALREGLDG